MSPELIAQFERLAALDIQILPAPQLTAHIVFERSRVVVLVERRGEALGAVGSPGLLNASGFLALVARGGQDWFIGKSESRLATPEEAAAARGLYRDLREVLG